MYSNFKYVRNDRFVAPFLLGALTGGVAVGVLNRPQPIYQYSPYPVYQAYPYYYY